MNQDRLKQLRVLVTRPRHQQQSLCDAIRDLGASAVSLPLLDIIPIDDEARQQAAATLVDTLDEFQLLVFISSNAVDCAAGYLRQRWPSLPAGIVVVAAGPTTARAAEALFQCAVVQARGGMNSEAMLALPQLSDVSGKRILIVRGRGGRELLAQTLTERGAEVHYLEVYRREPIAYAEADIERVLQQDGINLVTVTSAESLRHLLACAGNNKAQLTLIPLIVPSPRIAEQAEQLGFSSVKIAQGADTDSYIAALRELAAGDDA